MPPAIRVLARLASPESDGLRLISFWILSCGVSLIQLPPGPGSALARERPLEA